MNPQPLEGIKACVFDAYGTLFDYASAAAQCRGELGDKLDAINALWREEQPQYSWLRTLEGKYAHFWTVKAGGAQNRHPVEWHADHDSAGGRERETRATA